MKCGWARIYCPSCGRQIHQRQIAGAHLAIVAASACDRCRCRTSTALVLALALAAGGCGVLEDGPAPDDMIDVGGAHIARGCILHRPADEPTCAIDSGVTCEAYTFEGATGCCILGDPIDDEPALYWRDCEGP